MKYKLPLFIFSLLAFSVIAHAQLQKINTFAGTGFAGFSGDGNNASGATLWGPIDVALDGLGNVYISDHFNYRVRKVNAAGLITTIAGNGNSGYTGDSSIGSSAEITPRGLAIDKNNNVFISDAASNVVRKINSLGLISTVAGGNGRGFSGDGGHATAAKLNSPAGMTFDSSGNLYIADQGNHAIRKVTPSGIISTVAGVDTVGYTGDGFAATSARLDSPYAVAADRRGNLYIADFNNNVIRIVDATNTINTYVGTGVYNYTGDGSLATAATLNGPRGLAVDTSGNLYISDANNNVIRKVTTSTGIISTVAGNGYFGYGGDLGYAVSANLFNPYGIAVDAFGSIYIADANNERVRKTYDPNVGVGTVTAVGNGIDFYPNPSVNYVTLSNLAQYDKIYVDDITGRQVSGPWEVAGPGTQTFNVNSLASGVYLLKVCDGAGNQKAIMKLIKE